MSVASVPMAARQSAKCSRNFAFLALLTPLVLLIHGYHPYADDGGIYVAGVERMVHPTLYGQHAAFAVAHTRFSIFSHLFGALVRELHCPLEPLLLFAYLVSIFLFLLACFQLASRLFAALPPRWGAVLLAAACFTLPVAGTSLSIMDPYLTARSFSTPFSIFAIVAVVDGSRKRTLFWLFLTAVMHPLMAIYLAVFLLAYALIERQRYGWLALACAAAFVACAVAFTVSRHTQLPAAYREAVLSRRYFFLARWYWFEIAGLVVPLGLMLLAWSRFWRKGAAASLCLTCVTVGATAMLCSLCFVHQDGSFLLARAQLLRNYQLIYLTGLVLLGGWLANTLGRRRAWPPAVLFGALAALMLFVQLRTYPYSAHVEWPGAVPINRWQQAFLWIRANTPQTALFAASSNYTQLPTEDTQNFRAMAERPILADYLKDGGVAAMFPVLAPQWQAQRRLTAGLNHWTDQQRIAHLKPAGVTWVLLAPDAATALPCPFRNAAVLVCRLP